MILRDVETHSARWHELRSQGIGGSEIGAVFGIQPDRYDTAYTIFNVKKGRIEPRNEATDRMEDGILWEPYIAEIAAKKRGWKIKPGGYAIMDGQPELRASIDVEIEEPTDEDRAALGDRASGPGIMQVKKVADWWHYRKTWVGGFPPPYIGLQHQHELAASGFKWGAIVVMAGGHLCPSPTGFRPILEPARPRLIREIRERVAAFWKRVQNPDDDGSDLIDGLQSTSETVAALWPAPVPEAEPLDLWDDKDAAELCGVILAERAFAKESDKRLAAAMNRLKLILGSATQAETEGFRISAEPNKNGVRSIRINENASPRRIPAQ